jgi:hypothetical protein
MYMYSYALTRMSRIEQQKRGGEQASASSTRSPIVAHQCARVRLIARVHEGGEVSDRLTFAWMFVYCVTRWTGKNCA